MIVNLPSAVVPLSNFLFLSFITHMDKLTKSRKNSIPVASYGEFQVQHMAVSQFSNVSCIFLFERSPGYRMRAMYHGVCLFGEESNAPPESFVQEMGELEMEDIFSRGSHEPCTGAPGRRRPNPDRDGCG